MWTCVEVRACAHLMAPRMATCILTVTIKVRTMANPLIHTICSVDNQCVWMRESKCGSHHGCVDGQSTPLMVI